MIGTERILGDGTRTVSAGEGHPLVLVHGVGMDLAMWEPVARALVGRFKIICYDMIGHGASPRPAGPYRLADFVDQLERLAATLSLQRFSLLGFSMGGLVAQGFAAWRGGALDHLFLLNTVYRRSETERAAITARVGAVLDGGFADSVEAALDRWFTPTFSAAHPDVIAAVRRHMLGNDLAAYAAAYRVFATADAELADTASGIQTPTLVMTGSDDQRSTVAMAKALAADLPNGRLAVLPGQRHLTPLECPEDIAALIADFVCEHRAMRSEARHA